MATQCANPECPDRPRIPGLNHWVQSEEVEFTGSRRGEGPVRRLFAAVACSQRCAVAVMSAELPAKDAADAAVRQRLDDLFRPRRPESSATSRTASTTARRVLWSSMTGPEGAPAISRARNGRT